uniref:Neur_chan_memb domain-containing protein n=1 Tax=Anisakis simplex TaxID=6269 RepID=A0A0M3J383_ANISI
LLVSSVFTYQRVTFEGKILPIYYELVAWITMTGPLFVVPLTALYVLFDAYRNGKSIVDPVSRVASARRPNATMADDVGYNTMVEIINEWAKKNNFTSGSDDDAENQFQLSSNDNDDSVSKQTRLKNKHAYVLKIIIDYETSRNIQNILLQVQP